MRDRSICNGETISLAVGRYFHGGNWPRLSSSGFMVWLCLVWLGGRRGPIIGISQERLGELCGFGSRSTVIRALSELSDKGYVSRITNGRRGRSGEVYLLERSGFPEAVLEGLIVNIDGGHDAL